MKRRNWALNASVIAVSAACVLAFLLFYAPERLGTEFDDAYMFCRYASNFITGNGFTWNPADGPAYGVTSPAYLLAVTFARSLTGASNSVLLSLLSLASGLLALSIMALTGCYYGRKAGNICLYLLVVPLLLASSSFRYHSFTGMETMLSLSSNSLLILATLVYSRKQTNGKLAFLVAAALLTVQVRPDNGVFAVFFPLLVLPSIGRVNRRRLIQFELILLAGLLLLLLVWAKLLGSFLPISFFAKSGGYYQGYAGLGNWNQIEYLLRFLRDSAPFIVAALILGGRKTLSTLPAVLLPMILTFLYFSRATQVMGWFARYYFPFIPFLVFLSFVALRERLETGFKGYSRLLSVRLTVLVLILVPAFLTPIRSSLEFAWEARQSGEPPDQEELFETSAGEFPEHIHWWRCIEFVSSFVGQLPSGVSVAATENGYIAAENLHAEIIDMSGLHDMAMARNGFSAEKVLDRSPDVIWMPHTDYFLFRREIEENSDFREYYEYFPGVFNYGIALRLQSPFYEDCLDVLLMIFQEAYPGRSLDDYRGYPSS